MKKREIILKEYLKTKQILTNKWENLKNGKFLSEELKKLEEEQLVKKIKNVNEKILMYL